MFSRSRHLNSILESSRTATRLQHFVHRLLELIMAGVLNRRAYNKLVDEDLEWLLQQPQTQERDHIQIILKAEIRGRKICPKCGFKDGEMFTSDLDWCPSCHHQWSGT